MNKNNNFKITGDHTMDCAGCERTIQFALSMLRGINSVESDWKTQIIQVDIDAEIVTSEKIMEELANIGYQVTLLD